MSFADPASMRSLTSLVGAVIEELRATRNVEELGALMEKVTQEMDFRHYALIHHDNLRVPHGHLVDLKNYPAAVIERLIGRNMFRRDPVIRGCVFAEGAFLWSDLPKIIVVDRHDRASLEAGAREGLNEGITVPYVRHGDRMGSCTFAGTANPDRVGRYLGAAQMIGMFAFQAARRFVERPSPPIGPPRLHPRPRDCVVLAGRGLSNKEIARKLGLAPRTVDGYLTEARQSFQAHDRTELVISAVLAGEIELYELRRRQPEHSLGL